MSKPTLIHLPEICSTEATTAIDLYHEANREAVLCWVFFQKENDRGKTSFFWAPLDAFRMEIFQYFCDLPRIELFRKPSET